MHRTLLLVTLALGCDAQSPEPTGKEEAGQVALGCLKQMTECEDWTPVPMKGAAVLPLEDCGDDSYDRYDCERRNEKREDRNFEIQSAPKLRSPCQQKIDACVTLVEGLVGAAPGEVHHHH